jgi:hypothetical protein
MVFKAFSFSRIARNKKEKRNMLYRTLLPPKGKLQEGLIKVNIIPTP